ncbi:serine protease, partial [Desulfobulbus sp. TB]|nr:serine protease [Desulfobulbus sp. TB]
QAQKNPVITVRLTDGSEQQVSLVQISRKDNLALLSVQDDAVDAVYSVLQPPPQGSLLRLGDTVVLPRGFAAQKTMTLGTFAGYRRVGIQNRMYLQIHAQPVQHTGNTAHAGGTPVLDTSGNVRAVVTKTVQDSRVVYFALPFARVLDEFAEVLHEKKHKNRESVQETD